MAGPGVSFLLSPITAGKTALRRDGEHDAASVPCLLVWHRRPFSYVRLTFTSNRLFGTKAAAAPRSSNEKFTHDFRIKTEASL